MQPKNKVNIPTDSNNSAVKGADEDEDDDAEDGVKAKNLNIPSEVNTTVSVTNTLNEVMNLQPERRTNDTGSGGGSAVKQQQQQDIENLINSN